LRKNNAFWPAPTNTHAVGEMGRLKPQAPFESADHAATDAQDAIGLIINVITLLWIKPQFWSVH
jgi:hypothetical protein